jgi:hypothetical protein
LNGFVKHKTMISHFFLKNRLVAFSSLHRHGLGFGKKSGGGRDLRTQIRFDFQGIDRDVARLYTDLLFGQRKPGPSPRGKGDCAPGLEAFPSCLGSTATSGNP